MTGWPTPGCISTIKPCSHLMESMQKWSPAGRNWLAHHHLTMSVCGESPKQAWLDPEMKSIHFFLRSNCKAHSIAEKDCCKQPGYLPPSLPSRSPTSPSPILVRIGLREMLFSLASKPSQCIWLSIKRESITSPAPTSAASPLLAVLDLTSFPLATPGLPSVSMDQKATWSRIWKETEIGGRDYCNCFSLAAYKFYISGVVSSHSPQNPLGFIQSFEHSKWRTTIIKISHGHAILYVSELAVVAFLWEQANVSILVPAEVPLWSAVRTVQSVQVSALFSVKMDIAWLIEAVLQGWLRKEHRAPRVSSIGVPNWESEFYFLPWIHF